MSPSNVRPWRIGIDIGGTFTDGIMRSASTGMWYSTKVLSTPNDLSVGFVHAIEQLLGKAGDVTGSVDYVAHGTTIATNAVIEGDLAPVALVTTKGFRDVLEIARQVRPDPYDVFATKPKPLVPRNLCFEADERMSAEGTVLRPLNLTSVVELAAALRAANVSAVAVTLLHSYANPTHERQLGTELAQLLPGVPVTLSSALVPEFREYPRACTTVINAGLIPKVGEYLHRVEDRLDTAGIVGARRVMQSNGGLLSFAQARREPVKILESGPAAGLIGAAKISRVLDRPMLISFDMGGTTAKVGLVRNGVPDMAPELEVGDQNRSRSWFTGASGYPVLTSSVDLVEIGAGGGSIAWVDRGGMLRVGPASAGADPGPVCYGLGGSQPTITDANVVLGRMNPSGLLGGELRIDADAAFASVERIARSIGCATTEAALGILDIAAAAMARAARTISVERGYDPRDFSLAAFGGAGPLHAVQLAEELGVSEVIIQRDPGIASAIGLLTSDLRLEFSKTWLHRWSSVPLNELTTVLAELEQTARAAFVDELDNSMELRLFASLEMRYVGQSYQLSVSLPDGPFSDTMLAWVAEEFHRTHDARYGHSEPSEPIEVVNIRLSAVGLLRQTLDGAPLPGGGLNDALPADKREVTFRRGALIETPIFDRDSLAPGWCTKGPAVIEENGSTTLVPPGWQATVKAGANLVLARD